MMEGLEGKTMIPKVEKESHTLSELWLKHALRNQMG